MTIENIGGQQNAISRNVKESYGKNKEGNKMLSAEMLKKATAKAKEKESKRSKEKQKAIQKREEKMATSIITEAEKKIKNYCSSYCKVGYKKCPVDNLRVYTFREDNIFYFNKEYGRSAFLIVKKHFEKKGFTVSLELEIASRGLTHHQDTYYRHIYLAW